MKRIFSVLLCLLLLAGCGGNKTVKVAEEDEEVETVEETKEEFSYYGIWKADRALDGDKTYTIKELEEIGNYNLSDYYVQIREDGTSTISSRDGITEGKATISDDNSSVTIGKAALVPDGDDLLCEYGDDHVNFVRYSSSQNEKDLPIYEEPVKEQKETEPVKEEKAEVTTEPDKEERTGMSQEFLDAMNSYEEFMDEYCAFMDKYSKSDDTASLLMEYASFMAKYAKVANDFEKWEDEDMTDEELAYYTDVNLRVTQKLLKVAANN